ncbi:kinesin-like protein KIF3A isoform X2 [Lycorma delicatula]|uniref:kinesin-like protein KIF3A isoform X2 n=1 Tax=Lycorma delicatula TaxID=130591 RepID=UPI003F519E2B
MLIKQIACSVSEVEDVIKVVIRICPLSTNEIEAGCREIITLDDYNATVCLLIDKVLAGFIGTIFVYGQTGTGKTYIMKGIRTEAEQRGIIQNSFTHIFGHIAKSNEDSKSIVRVSYFEIYNDQIRDLLSKDPTVHLEVEEHPDIGVYVKDLSTYIVNNADEMDKIMTMGNKNRVITTNTESPRSHAIFSITVETCVLGANGEEHIKIGRLHLVDLAGSEKQTKSGTVGQKFREAPKIDLPLSTLGNIISALVDGRCTHIPYRNSKLNHILQDSLGGKTAMCATIGPADCNYDEANTLRNANRVKNNFNKGRINEDPKDTLLRQFQQEIKTLRHQLDKDSDIEYTKSENKVEERVSEYKSVNKNYKMCKVKPMDPTGAEGYDQNTKENIKYNIEQVTNDDLAHDDLTVAMSEQKLLKDKLITLEKKILVGGENLLEKADEQERVLEISRLELEKLSSEEELLKQQLKEKEAERADMEAKHSNLQKEAVSLSMKLKILQGHLKSAQEEQNDIADDNECEMEGRLDIARQLTKEIGLQEALIKMYIPDKFKVWL